MLALRCLLGGLLLWAAVSKLANPTAFLGSLYAYELPLPRGVFRLVAVVLPWTELLAGLMLVTGVWVETALLLTAGLLGLFVLATAQAVLRGLEISCGCFDLSVLGLSEGTTSSWRWLESAGFALVRNLALLATTLWVLRDAGSEASATGASRENLLLRTRGRDANLAFRLSAPIQRRRKKR